MRTVTDRDRWLALGLLLGVLVVAYFVLVHPWWTVPMLAENDRIHDLRERELRARMQLKQGPQVARELAQAQAEQARVPGFLPESTDELATAGLVQRLQTVVAQASPGNRSCAITNRSPLEDARPGRFPRVTVQVRLRCGTGEMAAVLHALESGTPRLFVDNLSILAQRYFFAPGQGGNQSGGLDVSFDLYGYLRPPPGRATTPDKREATNAP
ncbi:MAG TPA: type II secretion system protein GspM [Lysobacter sp.]|nr:type II secretion system protein GspM [Lysobacter sp.]